jgi:hypothetical protein
MKRITKLPLLVCVCCLVGCAHTRYEYKTVHTIGGVNERTTKEWTLDQVIVNPDGSRDYLLKRPVK